MPLGPRTRVLLIAAVVLAALAALVWYLSFGYWSQPVTPLPAPRRTEESATPQAPAATPQPRASVTPSPQPSMMPPAPNGATPATQATPAPAPSPQAQNNSSSDAGEGVAALRLLIPVVGVKASELRDTFSDARSEGRVHDAIDIPAPRNTPVVAAADGRVVRLFHSAKGGTTIYQLASADEHFVFYYAHLDHYADGLAEGHVARRGETIGYVGDTGDAAPGNTHLHFQIYRVADPRHFWTGENINPYPILRKAE
ncbi:MAG TPA: peptidoglycan DD-metalloendopeptidase family protein [Pyrinomonadaceae bacterium]|jgi:murein DD-endopeptidase MepM/ murein hydrolase activator NlpD|nr:peptidoglycan DD-metalloendopeptidase family protein [Pyrinomonadaceae bacterium]